MVANFGMTLAKTHNRVYPSSFLRPTMTPDTRCHFGIVQTCRLESGVIMRCKSEGERKKNIPDGAANLPAQIERCPRRYRPN